MKPAGGALLGILKLILLRASSSFDNERHYLRYPSSPLKPVFLY